MTRTRRPAMDAEGRGEDAEVPTPSPATWWQSLVGRLAERLAHEIRNPLNGAMVNLQVVSSRAARPGQDAAALAPFAAAAATELERSAALVESLLDVLRPERAPADVAESLRKLGELYTVVLSRSGGTLAVLASDTEDLRSSVSPGLIRLALAAVLDAAAGGGGAVTARVQRTAGAVDVELRCGGGLPEAPAGLAPMLSQLGVQGSLDSDGYVLHFPALAADDA